jgi:dTDP-4-dehydrorhamnose reductase
MVEACAKRRVSRILQAALRDGGQRELKVLVTGAGGGVGQAMVAHCVSAGDEVFAHDHASLDIADGAAVRATLERERPETVINCAAWTDVDGCQSDSERAYAANARGPENLANGCREVKASLITISTDFIFDGAKEGFYTQRDDPRPQSVYSKSKLYGERLAQAACARTIVVRTGWVFSVGGQNFLSAVIGRVRRGEHIKAIGDAYGTPTSAVHLAARLRELAVLDLPGIYHVTNSGDGTTYEKFTHEALKIAGCEAGSVESVEMDSLKRPAPRPRNSRLRCLISPAIGLAPLPDWQDALREFALVSDG